MNKITNADRADWAVGALTHFIKTTGADSARDAIGDLICDLLHLAHIRDYPIHDVVNRALAITSEELIEEEKGDSASTLRAFRRLLPID